MYINDNLLKYDEMAIFALRQLYASYGYSLYKMSKFEEYDFYLKNKDFLISDGVITFTDTNGKLMALKPDVTLSIIKNTNAEKGFVQKFYYNENVYRISPGSKTYKEIMQAGLECIGDIDDYCIAEVLSLAAKSLASFSDDAVLDISHLGILSDVFDWAGVNEESRDALMKLIGEKNSHEAAELLRSLSVDEEKIAAIVRLVNTYGRPSDVFDSIEDILSIAADAGTVDQLKKIIESANAAGAGDIIRIDFSVTGDINYYNGIVFRGFISGIPRSVLSGGQYDRLMRKMQKSSGAIGFAVYLDMLERLLSKSKLYDVDTVIVYDNGTLLKTLNEAVEKFKEKGSVSVQRSIPKKLSYKTLVKLSEGEVTILENNA